MAPPEPQGEPLNWENSSEAGLWEVWVRGATWWPGSCPCPWAPVRGRAAHVSDDGITAVADVYGAGSSSAEEAT
ncbi:hypothetical protein GCM10009551_055110 [Nocardiopsis tropica]